MPLEATAHDGKKSPVMDTFGTSGEVYGATIVVASEDSNTVDITIQLTDFRGADLATRSCVRAYLSDDANGDSITATGPSSETAVGTDGVLMPIITKKAYWLTSESDGDIDLVVTETGSATWYLILVMPDGRLVASDAITLT